MKKIAAIVTCLLLSVCVFLTGCSKLENPDTLNVSSNGGSVVKIGNYLYFANTLVDYSTLTNGDNETDKTGLDSIHRVKLEDEEVSFNDKGVSQNNEKVMGKIAGFEYSNMFVSGEYIFFTTPNIHKNDKSENRFDLVSLFKVKVNGKGLKEILTTNDASSSFHYAKIDGKDYLLVRDGSNLFKVEMFGRNTKTTLVDNLTNIAFDKNESFNTLYYTTAREDSLSGNVLNKVNIENGTKTPISSEINETYTLLEARNGTVYYTKTQTDLDAYYYYNDFSDGVNSEKVLIYATSISDLKTLTETIGGDKLVTYIFQDNLYIDNLSTVGNDVVLESNNANGKAKEILLVDAEYVYFTTENGIFRIEYKNSTVQKISSSTTLKTTSCDKVDNYFYYYDKVNESEDFYLHRAYLSGNDNIRVQVVSALAEEITNDLEETLEKRA